MTELNFVLRLSADGKSATAEVRSVTNVVKEAKAEAEGLAVKGREAAGGVGALGGAAGGAAPKVDGLAAAERRAVNNAVAVEKNHTIAAGSVGNLAAQFSAVSTTAVAGQAPLQTLIQQGTQIGQAFGNAGAASALKMVGAGILQMLNPVGLLTTAAFAAGAAFYQWLTSSETEVKSLDDAVSDLEGTVKALRDAAKVTAADLKKDFGEITPGIVRLNAELAGLANAQSVWALKDAFAALKGEVEGDWLSTDAGQVADLLAVPKMSTGGRGGIKGGTNAVVSDFQASLQALNDAEGPTRQLAALRLVNDQFVAATGGLAAMNLEQRAYYQNILVSERALRGMVAAQEEAEAKQRDLLRATGTENDRMGAPPPDMGKDVAQARALSAELKEQANLRSLIARYGEDSVQVARARSLAEQAVVAEMVVGLDVAAATKTELMAQWDAAYKIVNLDLAGMFAAAAQAALGISQADMAGAIAAASSQASGLVGGLAAAAGWAVQIGRNILRLAEMERTDYSEWSFGGPRADRRMEGPPPPPPPPVVATTFAASGGGAGAPGGGASPAAKEANAVKDLIARLQDEMAIQRESNPLKAELLRYRKDLAGATAAERKQVETLIATEQRLAATREAVDFLGQSSLDAMSGILQGGEAATDAVKNLGKALLDAALQSVWLGSGPLAALFGFNSSALSLLLPSAGPLAAARDGGYVPGFAAGGDPGQAVVLGRDAARAPLRVPMRSADLRRTGLQTGPGGPRDDLMTVRVSAGEYIVNGASTARYRPLLERINAGADIPGYAAGGVAGQATRGSDAGRADGGQGGDLIMNVYLEGAKGDREIGDLVIAATATALKHYDREVLHTRVKTILRQNGKVSG